MSKQSEAKLSQNYVTKAVPKTCMNCANYRSDLIPYTSWSGMVYQTEKNMKCVIGGFSVKKMGSCDRFEMAVVVPAEC